MQGSTSTILALLPLLVAGYVFNFICLPSRYFAQRVDGQRLLFMSALSGLLLGFVCFSMREWAAAQVALVTPSGGVESLRAGVPVPFGLTLLGTIMAAPLAAFAVNLVIWLATLPFRFNKSLGVRQFVSRRLTRWFGDSFLTILRQAADDQKLLMVCLKSRKVYVGSILEIPADIDKPSHIKLLPKFSGYRHKDTLEFARTTEYRAHLLWTLELSVYSRQRERELFNEITKSDREIGHSEYLEYLDQLQQSTLEAIESLRSEMSHGFSAEDWIKVLVTADIESVSLFDETAYSNWFLGDPRGAFVNSDRAQNGSDTEDTQGSAMDDNQVSPTR